MRKRIVKRAGAKTIWMVWMATALAVSVAAAQAPTAPQVRIEARVLEWRVRDGLDFDFAVRYQRAPDASNILNAADLTLPADPTLTNATRLFFDGMDASGGSIDAMIEALETVGDVRVLSQPSIMLTSKQTPLDQLNQPTPPPAYDSKLANSIRVPYETVQNVAFNLASVTDYRDQGVTLNVSVLHVADSLVALDMHTEVKDLTDFISVGLNPNDQPMRVPVMDTRVIENRLIVPDRTPVIAGLIKTQRQIKTGSGVPWISELPVLKWFLSNRRERTEDIELVFLIKPEIVTPYQPVETPAGS